MAGSGSGSIRKNQEKIKNRMRDDIMGTQSVANQLTGKEQIGTKKLKGAKTPTTPSPVTNDRQLEKFLDFMEDNYKNSLLNVELKRKV